MTEIYTLGRWRPKPGEEEAFVEAWSGFAAWASGMAGAGTLRLVRDVRDSSSFLSFGTWASVEAVRTWKAAPAFRERLARVRRHVAEFEPTELVVVASATAGAAGRLFPEPVEPVHAV